MNTSQVNPYETDLFADVIHRALTMPTDERELRMKLLRKRERERDVNFWLSSFLKSVHCYTTDTDTKVNKVRIVAGFFAVGHFALQNF